MTTICNTEIGRFKCTDCSYQTNKKSSYTNHLLTRKHIFAASLSSKALKICPKYSCDICSKIFKERTSLWRHKQKCSTAIYMTSEKDCHIPADDNLQVNLILELVKQNQEFKQLLIEQNNTILEVTKNSCGNNNTINNNTISNSNNNSNNKTFNLNFFLNETCKDAMNMKDFIKSLDLSMTELEKMGELGFAEGMSRLFVNRLNSLDITKRPIHCSDVKREIIHIKDDNKWERDNANLDRLRKIIKQITHKNILRVDDWKQANPGCSEYNNKKNGQYLKIHLQAIGPVDDMEVKRDFGKIIRRVAESTAIDKKYLC